MFLVAGITGNVGGATARALLDGGKAVRALVRDPGKAAAWAQRGVEVLGGDLNDAAAVTEALDGVEGAFLMIPPELAPAPGHPQAKATIESYSRALKQAPPPLLALLSSFGSEQPSGLGIITSTHMMEEAMNDLPFPVALMRAGSFMENYGYALQQAQHTGAFDIFLSPVDRPVPMVATADIGQEVARLLLAGWTGKKIVEIGTRFSPDDLARAISEALGKPVQARAVPRQQWAASLAYMGVPAGATGPYEEMMDSINSGWINFGVIGTEPVAATVTPSQFYARVKSA